LAPKLFRIRTTLGLHTHHRFPVISNLDQKKEISPIFQLGLIDSPSAMAIVKTKNVYGGGEENIDPTRALLQHVMREIWNDHSGDPFVHQRVTLTHNSQTAERKA
jgi:hypothetical protein